MIEETCYKLKLLQNTIGQFQDDEYINSKQRPGNKNKHCGYLSIAPRKGGKCA